MRYLVTLLALASLGALATGCGETIEPPTCGAGTLETPDGCVPDPAERCGPGTVFNGTTCVLDGDLVGPIEDTGPDVADTGTTDADTAGPPPEDVPDTAPDLSSDVPCVPSCDNRVCGDDGCGGSCGTCTTGACSALGRCVPEGWTCADFIYEDRTSCDCGCGVADPDCALDPAPPTYGCTGNDTCEAGKCVACTPSCGAGVECGDDGCGGSCGRCWDPAKPMCIDGQCVDECVPNCSGYECGPDGCGGVCGVCGAGEHCVLSVCEGLPDALSCVGRCGDVAPGGCSCTAGCTGSSCCGDAKAACACIPMCDGKSCGPDGCGGECGTCGAGKLCDTGACVDDRCDPNPCSTYGTCADGACSCRLGYGGAACDQCADGYLGYPDCKRDPCLGVDCGPGTCEPATGTCACPDQVTGARCEACVSPDREWPACTAPTCSGPDGDGDLVPDACDACPENGDLATFNWVTWNTPITGNTATGTVGNTTVAFTSDRALETTPEIHRYAEFFGELPEFHVPSAGPVLKNAFVTTNTLTFGRPIADPLFLFSSIGTAGLAVPIEFSADIEILWGVDVTRPSPRVLRGEEGYAIVRIKGVHESITFKYTVAENWANFLFGFGGDDAVDYDNDGTADVCQQDLRNNVGCSDGGREGFTDTATYPDIAACAGGWSVPGLVTLAGTTITDQTDRCGNVAGDDSTNPSGAGCSGEDLCAVGWSVCADQATVAANAGPSACTNLGTSVAAPYLFATRQRSQGGYICDISLSPQGANDVYGCGSGTFGNALGGCGPLNRVTDDNCNGVAAATDWECNDNDPASPGSIRELADVTKPSAAGGGVLCCRN